MADKETDELDVEIAKRISDESEKLYKQNVDSVLKSTDTLFAILFLVQGPAVALIPLLSLYSSPEAPTHTVTQALTLGAAIAAPAALIAWVFRGKLLTRFLVAILQMAMSALLIYLSSGRIETHFHTFGSLAILAFYRDWRVLFTAGVFAIGYHLVCGLYAPETIYGSAVGADLRTLEHITWILFALFFLEFFCHQMSEEMQATAQRQAELLAANRVSADLNQAMLDLEKDLSERNREIIKAVEELAYSTVIIMDAASQLSENATQTAAAVTETTTIAAQVRETVEVSSQKAKNVSEDAKNVLETSQTGQKATDDTVKGMQVIHEHMETMASSMIQLSNQTRQIGDIISTVDDLAQQSNLLAVNASIEASRAGEHGKGFSVVAQEVKNLAAQSKQATNRVRSILNEIVQATASATISTEQGSKAVEAGGQLAQEAGEAMVKLSDSIRRSAQAAVQIEASSQQQLHGVGQVLTAMKSVESASEENLNSARELEQAVSKLNDLGQRLRQLLKSYQDYKESFAPGLDLLDTRSFKDLLEQLEEGQSQNLQAGEKGQKDQKDKDSKGKESKDHAGSQKETKENVAST